MHWYDDNKLKCIKCKKKKTQKTSTQSKCLSNRLQTTTVKQQQQLETTINSSRWIFPVNWFNGATSLPPVESLPVHPNPSFCLAFHCFGRRVVSYSAAKLLFVLSDHSRTTWHQAMLMEWLIYEESVQSELTSILILDRTGRISHGLLLYRHRLLSVFCTHVCVNQGILKVWFSLQKTCLCVWLLHFKEHIWSILSVYQV